MPGKPTSAIIMARISDARDGITTGVDDQIADLKAYADRIGWGVGKTIIENDTSAWKRRNIRLPDGRTALRVWRPEYREALDDLYAGRHDGLIVIDLDRTTRDMRDLEDLIDVVESRTPRIRVDSISGSLDLSSDAGVTMARVMCAVGNKSSRDTSRRVSRARLRQATEGRFGGGTRRFGYRADGVTAIKTEAAEIRNAADSIIAGVSLRQIAADLRARSVPTSTGAAWTAAAIRDVLLRPRNAGLVVHRGEILDGVTGRWETVLPLDVWETVVAILSDPARRSSPGNTPRWLGSLIYRCGHPDCVDLDPPQTMFVGRGGSSKGRRMAYRCRRVNHLVRVAEWVDDYVSETVVAILSSPGWVDLVTPQRTVDVSGLAVERRHLQERIREAGALWEDGTLTVSEYRAHKARLGERLAGVESKLRVASTVDPLAGLAGAADVAARWAALGLPRRRVVVDKLLVVTVLPAVRVGVRGFDPDTVRIEPASGRVLPGGPVSHDAASARSVQRSQPGTGDTREPG